jgi:hypothetical protein
MGYEKGREKGKKEREKRKGEKGLKIQKEMIF